MADPTTEAALELLRRDVAEASGRPLPIESLAKETTDALLNIAAQSPSLAIKTFQRRISGEQSAPLTEYERLTEDERRALLDIAGFGLTGAAGKGIRALTKHFRKAAQSKAMVPRAPGPTPPVPAAPAGAPEDSLSAWKQLLGEPAAPPRPSIGPAPSPPPAPGSPVGPETSGRLPGMTLATPRLGEGVPPLERFDRRIKEQYGEYSAEFFYRNRAEAEMAGAKLPNMRAGPLPPTADERARLQSNFDLVYPGRREASKQKAWEEKQAVNSRALMVRSLESEVKKHHIYPGSVKDTIRLKYMDRYIGLGRSMPAMGSSKEKRDPLYLTTLLDVADKLRSMDLNVDNLPWSIKREALLTKSYYDALISGRYSAFSQELSNMFVVQDREGALDLISRLRADDYDVYNENTVSYELANRGYDIRTLTKDDLSRLGLDPRSLYPQSPEWYVEIETEPTVDLITGKTTQKGQQLLPGTPPREAPGGRGLRPGVSTLEEILRGPPATAVAGTEPPGTPRPRASIYKPPSPTALTRGLSSEERMELEAEARGGGLAAQEALSLDVSQRQPDPEAQIQSVLDLLGEPDRVRMAAGTATQTQEPSGMGLQPKPTAKVLKTLEMFDGDILADALAAATVELMPGATIQMVYDATARKLLDNGFAPWLISRRLIVETFGGIEEKETWQRWSAAANKLMNSESRASEAANEAGRTNVAEVQTIPASRFQRPEKGTLEFGEPQGPPQPRTSLEDLVRRFPPQPAAPSARAVEPKQLDLFYEKTKRAIRPDVQELAHLHYRDETDLVGKEIARYSLERGVDPELVTLLGRFVNDPASLAFEFEERLYFREFMEEPLDPVIQKIELLEHVRKTGRWDLYRIGLDWILDLDVRLRNQLRKKPPAAARPKATFKIKRRRYDLPD